MDRINAAGHVARRFVAEDLPTNRPPTEISAEWLNAVQEELAAVVEGFGGTLNPNYNAQILNTLRTFGVFAWRSDFSYQIGSLVINFSDGKIYRSLVNGNQGQNPAGSPEKWSLVSLNQADADARYATLQALSDRLTQAQGDARYAPLGSTQNAFTQEQADARYLNKSTSNTINTSGSNDQIIGGVNYAQYTIFTNGTGVGATARNGKVLFSVPNAHYHEDLRWLGDKAIVHRQAGSAVPEIFEDANRHIFRNNAGVEQLVVDDTTLYYKGQDILNFGQQALASSGYKKLPGGLILQWGIISGTATAENSGFSTTSEAVGALFPIAFPNACLNVQLTAINTSQEIEFAGHIQALNNTSFSAYLVCKNFSGYGNYSLSNYFFAIGY